MTLPDLSKPWAGLVPLHSVVRNPEQPRKTFPKAEIEALAGSMKATESQVIPCAVMPVPEKYKSNGSAWMLVDGEMRWRAAKLAGLAEVLVCYRPGVTLENLHRVSFAANFCRTAHTKHETALAIDKEHRAGLSYDSIGAMVGKTGAWAQQHHQLLQLNPELLKLVDVPDPFTGKKLAMRVALLFVGQDHERQMTVYRRHRLKTSSEQYHSVRTTAVVKAERKPSDDHGYVAGLLRTAHRKIEMAASVGKVMLRRMSAEQLRDLADASASITEALEAFDVQLGEQKKTA